MLAKIIIMPDFTKDWVFSNRVCLKTGLRGSILWFQLQLRFLEKLREVKQLAQVTELVSSRAAIWDQVWCLVLRATALDSFTMLSRALDTPNLELARISKHFYVIAIIHSPAPSLSPQPFPRKLLTLSSSIHLFTNPFVSQKRMGEYMKTQSSRRLKIKFKKFKD